MPGIGIGLSTTLCRTSSGGSPVVLLSGNSVDEDATSGTAIGELSVGGPPDATTYSFSITSDPDSKFAINADGVTLETDAALDYETAVSHQVEITATPSPAGDALVRTFTVQVSNVLEVTLAALTLSASTIAENSAPGTGVGAVQDTSAGSMLSLLDDAGGRFALSSGNIVAGLTPLNHEDDPSPDIVLRETHPDGANSPRDTTLEITVTDVAEDPVNTVLPAITGATDEGETLSCSTGTWSSDTAISGYAYQWTRDGGDISGATSSTYTLVAADVGANIGCDVTATNDEGNETASAAAVGPIVGTDSTPDAFTFTDVTDADLDTAYESNAITVAGITTSAAISITGGEYKVGAGSYTSASGIVSNGDEVTVRLTSSASYETAVSAMLTIGGVSDTYTVTTGTEAPDLAVPFSAWLLTDPANMTVGRDGSGGAPTNTDPVGQVADITGNGRTATATPDDAARPQFLSADGGKVRFDNSNDSMAVTAPSGWDSGVKWCIVTSIGAGVYGRNIPAGTFDWFPGHYTPGSDLLYVGVFSASDSDESILAAAEEAVGSALSDYAGTTDFLTAWTSNDLTSFPGTLDLSSGTNFGFAWRYNDLTSFPGTLNLSSGDDFRYAWGANDLTSFPTEMFDSCTATNYDRAFDNNALNQTSVDNILISINNAGTSNGKLGISGGTNSPPSATGIAARDALVSRGWTVTVNS